MAGEPLPDLAVLVGCVVVQDDMNGLARRDVALERVEEADELLMPVTLHVPSRHRAVEDVERSEECGRAVALVVVCHGRAASLLQRQAGLGSVERLDLRLLIDAEHHGVRGWCDIEADDVVKLLGEGRVVGELERAPAMRCEAMGLPNILHRRDGEPDRLGHRPRRPVGRLVRRRLQRHRHDGGRPVVGHRRPAGRAGLVAEKAGHALLHEPRLPAPDRRLRRARRRHDGLRTDAVSAEQHDPGAPDMFLRRVPVGDEGFEPLAVSLTKSDGYSCAHATELHARNSMGIPNRTHPSRSIH